MKTQYNSNPEGRLVSHLDVYNAFRAKVYFKAGLKEGDDVLTMCVSTELEDEGPCKLVLKLKGDRAIYFCPIGGVYSSPLHRSELTAEMNCGNNEEDTRQE